MHYPTFRLLFLRREYLDRVDVLASEGHLCLQTNTCHLRFKGLSLYLLPTLRRTAGNIHSNASRVQKHSHSRGAILRVVAPLPASVRARVRLILLSIGRKDSSGSAQHRDMGGGCNVPRSK